MKIKLSDIRLALENVPAGVDVMDLSIEQTLISKLRLEFSTPGAKHTTIVAVYDSSASVTPEITQISKLYKKV